MQLWELNKVTCDETPEKNIKLLLHYLTTQKEAEGKGESAGLTHDFGKPWT